MVTPVLLLGFAPLIAAIALLVWLRPGLPSAAQGLPSPTVTRKDSVLSPVEMGLHDSLRSVAADYGVLMCKVRVTDVLAINPGADRSGVGWSLASSCFHFVICEEKTLRPLCGVQLGVVKHGLNLLAKRHQNLQYACNVARFPLVQIEPRSRYDAGQLRTGIQDAIHQKTSITLSPRLAARAAVSAQAESAQDVETRDQQSPVCPNCNAPMVQRVALAGAYKGQSFWGCNDLQNCSAAARMTPWRPGLE